MTIDLNPCPCCGHRAIELPHRGKSLSGDWWTIKCLDCGLMIEGSDRQKVIDAWQRRRTDDMIAWLDAEIEFLGDVPHSLNRQAAFRDCKKQLLKLLDGMGN